jgi:hypothetical protein
MCRHNNSNRNIQRRNNHLLLNDWIADRHSNLRPSCLAISVDRLVVELIFV